MVVSRDGRATLWALVVLIFGTRADNVVYATADNGTTNLFGKMDMTTGQFTQITTTTPLFGSITVGAGGTLYGGEGNLNFNLATISPSGVPSQFGHGTQQFLWLHRACLGGSRGILRHLPDRFITRAILGNPRAHFRRRQ